MKQWFAARSSPLAVVSVLVCCCSPGCGPAPAKPTAKPAASVEHEKKTATPAPEVAAPKPVEVQANEFPSVAAALDELKRVLELPPGAEQNNGVQRCEKWLKLQGDKSVEPLAAITKNRGESLALRMTTCRLLGQYGRTAIPALSEIARSDDEKTLRLRAMDMLVRIKPTPPEVVQLFVSLLDAQDNDILVQTLYHLAKIGEPAAETAERLQSLRQKHTDETVRRAAGDALKKVAPRRTFVDK